MKAFVCMEERKGTEEWKWETQEPPTPKKTLIFLKEIVFM